MILYELGAFLVCVCGGGGLDSQCLERIMLNIKRNVDLILTTLDELLANVKWLFSIVNMLPFLHRTRVTAENALGNYTALHFGARPVNLLDLLDSMCTLRMRRERWACLRARPRACLCVCIVAYSRN